MNCMLTGPMSIWNVAMPCQCSQPLARRNARSRLNRGPVPREADPGPARRCASARMRAKAWRHEHDGQHAP